MPSLPTPVARDNSLLFASDSGQAWMSGNWLWFGILVIVFVFNTVLGERWRSSLIGIVVHSSQSVFFLAIGLALVLR